MKTYQLTIIAIAMMLMMGSCYEEDPIVPSSAAESGRIAFPQGSAAYDLKLQEVFEKFGVKVVYKNFTEGDFNLSWTSLAVGKVGYDVPADQQEEAAVFMSDYFFTCLTPEVTKKILPPYFYVADSISQLSVISNATTTLEMMSAYPYRYDGLDFWSFCWNGVSTYTKLNGAVISQQPPLTRPKDSFSYFYRRGVMLKEIYRKAVVNGNVSIPEGFNSGFDFTTPVKYLKGTEGDPNYYKTRGFPGQMTNTGKFDIANLSRVTFTNEMKNFIDYLHLCMRYTPDSIEINYPISQHPVIHEKYPIVINHMKDKYGVDLAEMAKKPIL